MEIVKSNETIFITDSEQGVTYYIPAMISSSYNANKTLTEYPTTEGTSMTDHAYKTPDELTMSISVGDIPLKGSFNCYYYSEEVPEKRVSMTIDSTKQLLQNWYDRNTRLTIQTRNSLLTNMILCSIATTDGPDNLAVYSPNLRFREARVATLKTELLGPFKTASVQAASTEEENTGNNEGNVVADVLGSTAAGATMGALVGSVIPGVGTAIGAVVGGAVGFLGSIFKEVL